MESIEVSTSSRTEFIDITSRVEAVVKRSGLNEGAVLVYVPHTTAGVTINENADPDVTRDVLMELNKVIPFDDGYAHVEGNSAAHIKSSLVGCSVLVPVREGQLVLGTWQGIYFCEFDGPRSRRCHVQLLAGRTS